MVGAQRPSRQCIQAAAIPADEIAFVHDANTRAIVRGGRHSRRRTSQLSCPGSQLAARRESR
jgi:hypothetical protein